MPTLLPRSRWPPQRNLIRPNSLQMESLGLRIFYGWVACFFVDPARQLYILTFSID